ncbi:MAG: ribosome maturation factor RimP [Lachnospiraceae bacterium]|nr:ribosome maturation factor RimP [Lachnospiraceae bacterium]
MTKRETYEARTEELILPLMEEFGFELVDVEFVKEGDTKYLRTYIDKDGGVTIHDCETVAKRMNDLLDEEDFIEESYIFEVSSPGLDRPLKKEKDFIRNMGKEVEIRTYRAIEGQKEFFGTLTGYTEDAVTIVTEEEETKTFENKEIALIRLAFDF